jgi:ATP-binding cassette subfamily C protein CydC
VQRVNPQQTIVGPLGTGENNQKEARYLPEEAVEKRLLKLLLPFSKRILLSVLLGFATIASGIGLMAAAAYIISAAALHPSIAELQVAIVGVRFFGLSRGVFRYLERLVSHDTTLRLLARWRTWFYQALEPLAPGRLMEYHSGDLLTMVISDIGCLENFYVRSIAPPLVAVLVGVTTSLFMGSFGGQLAWGLVVFLVLAGVGLPALALLLSRKVGPEILVERGRLSTLMVDGIQGMADLLTCGQAAAYKEKVRQAGEKLSRLQTHMAILTSMLNSVSSLLANLGMLFVLVLAIQSVSAGRLGGVLLGVVALTALTCFEAMQPMPLAAQNYEANRAAASRLYKLVDTSPLVTDPDKRHSLEPNAALEVRQLSFQYPDPPNIGPGIILPSFSLKDISFSLPHGKHIALIGESGAGKTTLINLLLRFWEYPAGSIMYGGNELRQYCQDDIRRNISIISQDTYLFSATINENLLIAHPQATDTEIIQATRRAQLHDFIISLPDGYNTWIGEHGLRLSAGERQRLALARALLKDASMLILDEPTANLDPDTELAVLNAIREVSQAYSSITITQSMISLESMDEILVLRDGRIIERGSHDQLISKPGVYKNMWDLYHQAI